MKLHVFRFPTDLLAHAFMDGVRVLRGDDGEACPQWPVQDAAGRFVVYVHDHRPLASQDVCPACGAGAGEQLQD